MTLAKNILVIVALSLIVIGTAFLAVGGLIEFITLYDLMRMML